MKVQSALSALFLTWFQTGILFSSGEPEYVPLPVHYIPPSTLQLGPNAPSVFVLPLCGGSHFNKETIRVSINLANHPWSSMLGDIIKADVKDAKGTLVGSNANASDWLQDFTFQYLCTMGDLYIYTKTGNGISYIFSIMVIFPDREITHVMTSSKSKMMSSSKPMSSSIKSSPCVPRWWVSPEESIDHKLRIHDYGDPIVMFPTFLTYKIYSTPNDKLSYYRLDYCFGAESTYNFTVTLVGNEHSGLGSYVCTRGYNNGTCDINTSFYDNSGGSLNRIEVQVLKKTDNGPIKLIVRGDGRYGTINYYTIGASRYY